MPTIAPARVRVSLCRALVTAICITSGVNPVHASSIVAPGEPPLDFMDQLMLKHQVFIGTVASVDTFRYVPSGPCAEGLTPDRIADVTIEVSEVVHGGGLRSKQHVRTFGVLEALQLKPGMKVVAGTNRTCADEWNTWGSIYAIGEREEFLPSMKTRRWIADWKRDHGRAPTLQDLRSPSSKASRLDPAAPFQGIELLHLVVVTAREVSAANRVEFIVKSVGRILGSGGAVPTRLVVDAPSAAPCRFIDVGDTLVVPVKPGASGKTATATTCLDYYRVEQGYLPGIGIALADLQQRVRKSGNVYSLLPLVQEEGIR